MFALDIPQAATKPETYAALYPIAASMLEGERDFIANAANISSLLFHTLPDLNWCGFYILRDAELVLGPFQGRPACIRIAIGRGVCGTAAERRETVVVPNVQTFPGHIACDSASRSEIVVPVVASGRLVGVLDLDSPAPGRFDDDDRIGLEHIVRTFVEATDVPL
ncbi:MAG: GAF domain-containing protein [Bacteroidetes bacterium]|nr:GAF domain-containing protein [Bacteroidota bacterium]